jgi:16S rRNA A1518/A1519 N6-dimethyltransferase RsmA/KsgA/DIM1 with predicted DNA glycosylase/AP lyase activity
MFSAVTEAIFTRRRKTLANALLALEERAPGSLPGRPAIAEVLGQTGLDPRQRPETLTLDDLVRLADAVIARKKAVLY